jgi:hypothetical protein
MRFTAVYREAFGEWGEANTVMFMVVLEKGRISVCSMRALIVRASAVMALSVSMVAADELIERFTKDGVYGRITPNTERYLCTGGLDDPSKPIFKILNVEVNDKSEITKFDVLNLVGENKIPHPVDLHTIVIAGWKGDYASIQGVTHTFAAIFMGEMQLDANKERLKTGTYKETVIWQDNRRPRQYVVMRCRQLQLTDAT